MRWLYLSIVLILISTVFVTTSIAAAITGDETPWKTRVELSYVQTSGNSDTQTLSGKFSLKNEGPIRRYYLSGNYMQASSDGDETSNKGKLDGSVEQALTEKLFAHLDAGYLRDKFSGYDFRAYGGGGFGYDFIKNQTHTLQGLSSLLYHHDQYATDAGADETGSDAYGGVKLTGKYSWQIRENMKFKETVDYSVSLKDTDRAFIDSITAVEVKINGSVSLGVSYTVNYQVTPPSDDVDKTDTTFLTTLIIDF